jgi:8-oxo-dGTP pyrophosphatase MutT (NUDIX family)
MIVQCGAIPYIIDRNVVKVMLVTSRSGTWIFPKGGRLRAMGFPESAAREALEEAGVRGRVFPAESGRYRYYKAGAEYEVVLYPLLIRKILPVWEESSFRLRLFGAYPQMLEYLENAALKKIVTRLCLQIMKNGSPEGGL